jgi:hypothetical protein
MPPSHCALAWSHPNLVDPHSHSHTYATVKFPITLDPHLNSSDANNHHKRHTLVPGPGPTTVNSASNSTYARLLPVAQRVRVARRILPIAHDVLTTRGQGQRRQTPSLPFNHEDLGKSGNDLAAWC